MKYYNKPLQETSYVDFKMWSKGGEVIMDEEDRSCYSAITYQPIPEYSDLLECYYYKKYCPYGFEEVNRWVELMNDWGFPVEGASEDQFKYTIRIRIQEYKKRLHLNSALIILRYLYEVGFNSLPSITFELIDANPDVDSFQLMQCAHQKLRGYFNDNHTLRDSRKMALLSREDFFKRVEDTISTPFDYLKVSISDNWSAKGEHVDLKNYKKVTI